MRIGKLGTPEPIEQDPNASEPNAKPEQTSTGGLGDPASGFSQEDSNEKISAAMISSQNPLGLHNLLSTQDGAAEAFEPGAMIERTSADGLESEDAKNRISAAMEALINDSPVENRISTRDHDPKKFATASSDLLTKTDSKDKDDDDD